MIDLWYPKSKPLPEGSQYTLKRIRHNTLSNSDGKSNNVCSMEHHKQAIWL